MLPISVAVMPNMPVEDLTMHYATGLLARLGIAVPVKEEMGADHPALAWRRAGLMAVTGRTDGPGLVCPVALTSAADGAMLALRTLAPDSGALPANGALLLGERARLMGLVRRGRTSANGSCRLLDTVSGCIALNLAREEDRDLLPILFGCAVADGWGDVERAASRHRAADLIALGIELGLPIALDAPLVADSPFVIERAGTAMRQGADRPLVLDFASLWAGPLVASLLGMLGARVVKVESMARLDGARCGHRGFFDLMNGNKRSITVDFDDPTDRARLSALVADADIVIEGSRPRALERLGIDRRTAVASGCIWISITAHRDTDRVGFGDDMAVAGGLASAMREGWGETMFAGDAIADPLTGLHAAFVASALWREGSAALVRLSLADVVGHAIGMCGVVDPETLAAWQVLAVADKAPLYRHRQVLASARPPGADNALLAGTRYL